VSLKGEQGLQEQHISSGEVDGHQLFNDLSHLTEPFTKAPSFSLRHSRSYLRIRVVFLFMSFSLPKLTL